MRSICDFFFHFFLFTFIYILHEQQQPQKKNEKLQHTQLALEKN